jgi:RNA polymerase sigma-70 factor (ECF subfamily)
MLLSRLIETIVRTDGRRVLAGLIRLTGDFDAAEDALQEAYARALTDWQRQGVPEKPGAWLNTVSRRIAIDRLRSNRRTDLSGDLPDDLASTLSPASSLSPSASPSASASSSASSSSSLSSSWSLHPGLDAETDDDDPSGIEDDRLRLLFVCCHPALSADARCTLALRTLGGLTTREIARGFVEPEATTAQRLVRAKRKIHDARIPYEVPARHKLPERVETVLSVLYLIFNEGYTSTDAPSLLRPDLVREAIRLARLAVELLPGEVEAHGLLALMLLTDSRRAARLTADGDLVPLEEQDRTLWDRAQIDEGVALLDRALTRRTPGPYQTQAAIAALHATAATAAETDWPQIAALYRALFAFMPTPIVELNLVVAMGLATHLSHALDGIARLEARDELSQYYLLPASKADILRRLGRRSEAAAAYREALELVTNPAERRYLERRLAAIVDDPTGAR